MNPGIQRPRSVGLLLALILALPLGCSLSANPDLPSATSGGDGRGGGTSIDSGGESDQEGGAGGASDCDTESGPGGMGGNSECPLTIR